MRGEVKIFMKTHTSGLTPSAQTSPPPPKPKLDPSLVAIGACTFGHYPWDDWERWAIARGLDRDLAGLARSVIREAFNHAWPEPLLSLCGWRDDGQALLAFALSDPEAARRQWEILLRTDGFRGEYRGDGAEWVWGYLRPDALYLLATLELQLSTN